MSRPGDEHLNSSHPRNKEGKENIRKKSSRKYYKTSVTEEHRPPVEKVPLSEQSIVKEISPNQFMSIGNFSTLGLVKIRNISTHKNYTADHIIAQRVNKTPSLLSSNLERLRKTTWKSCVKSMAMFTLQSGS